MFGKMKANHLRIKALSLLGVFLFPLFCFVSSAAVYTVSPTGDFTIIQEAIDASSDGDEIVVSPGTYYENINFLGKNIILRSTEPTSSTVVANTIIDGNSAGSVVTFSGRELASCVLSGFTITNGYALRGAGIGGNHTLASVQYNNITTNTAYENYPDWYDNINFEDHAPANIPDKESRTRNASDTYTYDQGLGGGVYMCDGLIQNNTITRNDAYFGGGLYWCDGTIQYNTISGNSATAGGGLYWCNGTIQYNTVSNNSATAGGGVSYCRGTIQHNTISGNSAIWYSGGIYCYYSAPIIKNNTISANAATHSYYSNGGGIYCYYSSPLIMNNTISGNSANQWGGAIYCYASAPPINDNIISGNSASSGGGIYCDYSSPLIESNAILGNLAYSGSGIYCEGASLPLITNNTIAENVARGLGGGIRCGYASRIMNNTIWGNSASEGGGISCGGHPLIMNNIILENSADDGAGIHCLIGSSPTITKNVISNNSAVYSGAGIYCWYSEPTITKNIVSGNSTSYGSGVCCIHSLPIIANNTIAGNLADDCGGIRCVWSSPSIVNNTISRNWASSKSGAILVAGDSSPEVRNNIFCYNNKYDIYEDWGDPVVVSYNDFYGNADGIYYDEGTTPYTSVSAMDAAIPECNHNIGDDPLFIGDTLSGGTWTTTTLFNFSTLQTTLTDSSAFWSTNEHAGRLLNPDVSQNRQFVIAGNTATTMNVWGDVTSVAQPGDTYKIWDYHLQSVYDGYPEDSPCIDAGDPADDYSIEPMPNGARINQGRYGNTPEAARTSPAAPTPTSTPTPTPTSTPTPTPTPTPTRTPGPCTIYVPADYPTIQQAIDAASDGCEIIVSPSRYYENIEFNGKNIVLRSIDPTSPTIVASTIIDANQWGSVVTFSGTELTTCVLSGFTITHGRAYYGGGGITANRNRATIEYNIIENNHVWKRWNAGGGGISDCDGLIQNNVISGNSAVVSEAMSYVYGGGLYGCDGIIQNNIISNNSVTGPYAHYGGGLAWCYGTIQNNTITGNTAKLGGGLFRCNGTIQNNTISGNLSSEGGGGLYGCDGAIQNNAIFNNWAYSSGGGLYGCNGDILNNTVQYNSAFSGGGIYFCNGTIQNNTILRNAASNNGGGLCGCNGTILNNTVADNSAADKGGGLSSCHGTIVNNIIWGNYANTGKQLSDCSAPFYCCIQDWSEGGKSCISTNPAFVDPTSGDYHLRPASPCIDAGNTFYLYGEYIADMDGGCRVAGTSVDIGADEYGSSVDSDGDLFSDADEFTSGTNPTSSDTDDDGLIDGVEVLRGTDPLVYDTPPNISVPGNYSTIQEAIFKSFPFEEITIEQGRYYENLHSLGKNITLQSTNPTNQDTINITILDGGELHSVITLTGTEKDTCIIRGFTITNGSAYYGGGICGGVFCGGVRDIYTLATVQNDRITTNSATYIGGGLYGCGGTIQDSTILDNVAGNSGGGLADCNGTIESNIIANNSANYGGGLSRCNGAILNSTITGNWAYYGAGLSWCGGTIQNNIISGNLCPGHSSDGGGLYECNGTIENNIISDNVAGNSGGLASCSGTIENNIISNNSANYGGGLGGCNGTILNNTITGNSATGDDGDGGGLSDCRASIVNNTITGNSAEDDGGGLYRCNATIENNIITDNWANSYGGGLYYCDGTIQNNTISYNSARRYGGLGGCNGTIQNNVISCNSAKWYGGGLSGCNGTIQNNTIWFNIAIFGAGLNDCDGTIQNNTIWNNRATDSGGGIRDCDGTIRNCIIWQNAAPAGAQLYNSATPTYSCIQDWRGGGTGNISADPQLLLPEYGNFHLHTSSPCIDAGCFISELTTDFEGDARPFDGTEEPRGDGSDYDIGADEYIGPIPTPTPTPAPCVIYVPADYGTIQAAIDAAQDGCEIIVSPGTYYENINFEGKDIILRSTEPTSPSVVAATVIDGSQSGTVVTFSGTESPFCELSGFTITNGKGSNCGGIEGKGNLATIQYNIIKQNSVDFGLGGGIYWCNGAIQNNVISNNSADYGGGLAACNGCIQNNIISFNSAEWYGGGISYSNATIQNNTIFFNSASTGAGLYYCHGAIQNNTIWNNRATRSVGGLEYCNGTIRNCIIWQNTAPTEAQLHNSVTPTYSCIQGWTAGGTGNVSSDPQLVDPDNGDFHLKPTSPCIDAGCYIPELAFDFEGNPRPWDATSELRGDGSDFDIGADEYTGLLCYDFSSGDQGWTRGTATVFMAPQWVVESGCLKLISQSNTNTFGYWSSPENAIPVTEEYLYRARFVVSTDVAQPELVPEIRLRVNSRNLQQADCLTIDSSGDGGASPTPEGKTYDLYFVPATNDDYCMLAFDLLNFNPYDAARAELALESVLVDRFSLDTLDDYTTTIVAYDFETSQEFWSPGDGTLRFADPEFFWDEGALHLRSTTNTSTFGYWHNDPIDIIVDADRLYRGIFELRTDEPEQSRVPEMRLRFNTSNMQACRSLEIASVGDGANSPGTTNTIYDRLYFLPPSNCIGNGLIVSFDILNFSPDDAPDASLILDRATIETLSPPNLP